MRFLARADGGGIWVAARSSLMALQYPHGEERGTRVSNHEGPPLACGHPSRRPLLRAPQDEVRSVVKLRNYRASSISSWLCAFFTAPANQLWLGASLAKHLV
ncbi:hypothetical protein ACVWXQ_001780 [Bradyrhizobium sp. S3.14.4]